MAHWAELDENNIVIRVLIGSNDELDEGYQWLIDNFGGTWVKTSYNTRGNVHYDSDGKPDGGEPLHKNYAGIGYKFDNVGFIPPQPFPSWILDLETYLWQPPTPRPEENDKYYEWNENNLEWVEIIVGD